MRVIDINGEQLGILNLTEALKRASEQSLDLVEVSPHMNPVVCKIMDYSKHRFKQKKRAAANRKKQQNVQIKQLRLHLAIDENDYQIKLRYLTRFINDGHNVHLSLRLRGREKEYVHKADELLKRIVEDVSEVASVAKEVKLEGWQMKIVFSPKNKNC